MLFITTANLLTASSYIRAMFSFNLLSMNLVYLVFTALYVLTFGVYSYHKLEQKLQLGKKSEASEIIISERNDNIIVSGSKTYDYRNSYYSEEIHDLQVIYYSRVFRYPPGTKELEIPPGYKGYAYFSRPPPSVPVF